MKQKKLVSYFFIISISLTLLLPVLNLSFAYKHKIINLHSFSKQQLFSTNNIESIKNYFAYKMFNISLNESQVVVGKDKFFFLGNSFRHVINKAKGTFLYSNKDIGKWANKLKELQDWYEEQGIQFIVVVASNKHTVYSDKLPNGIVYKENETITDYIVKDSRNKGIHILNLKKSLRERKKDHQLYFRTDTHWNNYGGLVGYINSIKYLNNIYKKNYRTTDYSIEEKAINKTGDLTNFLRINNFISDNLEKSYSLTFNKTSEICYGEITKANKLKMCSPTVKKTFNQYIINNNSSNKEKLLYLCDSFGIANTKVYKETFNTVWRFHLTYTNGGVLADFIQEHKPDVVIYQIVERDLGNNSIISDIPSSKK